MRRAAALAAAASAALAAGAAASAAPRAVGLYGFDPKSPAFSGLDADGVASRVASWGVTAVFLETAEPDLARALKRAGIRRFVDLTCFAGERHWKRRPESRPINSKGEPIAKVDWYAGVCPNQAWLRAELLRSARRHVRDGADGLWLDFIRYPARWEVPSPALEQTCFCPACLAAFERASGLKLPPGGPAERAGWILERHARLWTRFKADTIASFAAEVRRAVRGEARGRPVLVGLFAVPWTEEERGGAILEFLGQDFKALAASVDVFSPMAYHQMIGRPPEWLGEIADYFIGTAGKPVWPILFAGDSEIAVSAEELERATRSMVSRTDGVLFLSFPAMLREGKLEMVRRVSGLD